MGLDTTHGAFHGAYSAFNRFRQIVAMASGGSWPPHDDPEKDDGQWYFDDELISRETHPGLFAFFEHSDCDGNFSPEECAQVANDLEELLPKIAELDDGGGGHIARRGGYVAVTQKFIDGCRRAAEAGEQLGFH